jgi:Tfp pilus assembly protein PilV
MRTLAPSSLLFAAGFIGLVSLSASANDNPFANRERDRALQNQAQEFQNLNQGQTQMPCVEKPARKDHSHTIIETPLTHKVKKSRKHFLEDGNRVAHTDIDAVNHSNSSDSQEDTIFPQEKRGCPKEKVKSKPCVTTMELAEDKK